MFIAVKSLKLLERKECESAKLRALRALAAYVPCALRAVVPHDLRALRALVLHVPDTFHALLLTTMISNLCERILLQCFFHK